jgi:hypothetical protein
MSGFDDDPRDATGGRAMPEPGSKAYDKKRQELRNEFDDQGVQGGKADERANQVLQGDINPAAANPKADRSPDTGHGGRGREASQ